MISLPGYYEDPLVPATQKRLFNFGNDMLSGNVPSFLRPLAESGGAELEGILSMNTRDIAQAAAEDAARRGSRGGASTVAKAVADMTTKLRYQDFMRALEGKQLFLNTGTEILGGVRNAGITTQGQKNSFNLDTARLAEDSARYEQEREDKKKAAKAALYGQILSAGIGAAGNFYGAGMLSKAFSAGGGSSVNMLPASVSGASSRNLLTRDYYNF